MAITFTERDAGTMSSLNQTAYTGASYTPAANAGLVCFAFASATVSTTSSCAGNGLSWTRENHAQRSAVDTCAMFSALTGASPSTGAVTVTWTGDAATGCGIHVVEFAGVNLSDFVIQSAANNGTSAVTPSITFGSATAADSAIYVGVMNIVNPAAITPPSGYTEELDNGFANPTTGGEAAYHLTPGSVTTVTWGAATSTSWAAVGVEIAAAAAITASLIYPVGMNRALLAQ